MHGIEKRIWMRRYIEAGVSKAATARRLGISRRTVYNWIEQGELERESDDTTVQYGPRPPRPSKLDPWKIMIEARLAQYPRLSAAQLFREVRAKGIPGRVRAGQGIRSDRSRAESTKTVRTSEIDMLARLLGDSGPRSGTVPSYHERGSEPSVPEDHVRSPVRPGQSCTGPRRWPPNVS